MPNFIYSPLISSFLVLNFSFYPAFSLKSISFVSNVDIDECQQGTANCGPDEICKNKPGGYTCSCPAGHALNAQRRCDDIDECDFYKGQVNIKR